MEFIERLPLIKLHFLNSLTFKEFKPFCKSDAKNNEERKIQHKLLQQFCSNTIKANGQMKRLYKFTGNKTWGASGEGCGRLFASGGSVQGLPKAIRGFLLDGITCDIDMANAHPVILRYLCRKHSIPHDKLDFYINNRDEVLSQFADRDTGKTLFLKATNDDKINKKEKNQVFKDYDKQMKEIQKILTKLTVYEEIVNDVPATKLYNWYGSAINRILCFYENKVLQVILNKLNEKGIEICAPMFDGCMPYCMEDNELLNELENTVASVFPDLDMKLTFKSHSTVIKMPEDFEIKETIDKVDVSKLITFEAVAETFEKTHCKIINKSIFIKVQNDEVFVMSKPQLKTSYENLIYQRVDKTGQVVDENFIDAWMRNNPQQRCYDDIEVYPTGISCPKNIFNTWQPFAMENTKSDYVEKKEELEQIKQHIKILCGNDAKIQQYVIEWIAQMIQYPAVKTVCLTFISKQGAGKTFLIKLLRILLGDSKVFETTSPNRDVWGDFNGRMCNTFLINLNELSKKETAECEGKIKGLITDPKLTINNKGANQYDIMSYHRFIITTNNLEPINTSKDDRRNLIVRSSDEKCGDKNYFTELHKLLDDFDVMKTCYEYFKSIEKMNEFNKQPIPTSNHQENLKQLSICPIEQWLEHFTMENCDDEELEILGAEICNLFKQWWNQNNEKPYNITPLQLGIRINNLNIDGIRKGRHTNKGETKVFDILKMKAYFKIGCLLQL